MAFILYLLDFQVKFDREPGMLRSRRDQVGLKDEWDFLTRTYSFVKLANIHIRSKKWTLQLTDTVTNSSFLLSLKRCLIVSLSNRAMRNSPSIDRCSQMSHGHSVSFFPLEFLCGSNSQCQQKMPLTVCFRIKRWEVKCLTLVAMAARWHRWGSWPHFMAYKDVQIWQEKRTGVGFLNLLRNDLWAVRTCIHVHTYGQRFSWIASSVTVWRWF